MSTDSEIEVLKPTPELNPREQIMREIAERSNADADRNASETVDGMEPAAAEPKAAEHQDAEPASVVAEESSEPVAAVEAAPVAPAFDPEQEYDLTINGKPVKVKGSQIVERGKQALQKEIAADSKLEIASRLLNEAKAMHQAQLPQQGVPQMQNQAAGLSDDQLAEIIQFGTKEQAAQAITEIRRNGIAAEQQQQRMIQQIPGYIRDQRSFDKAAEFVQAEYGDLFADPYLKQLFLMKEDAMRKTGGDDGSGDKRPYMELYKEIGDDLRAHFNKQKPTPSATPNVPATREQKVAAKAAAPAAPKLASARIEAGAPDKPPTREEIIQRMQVARGQRVA